MKRESTGTYQSSTTSGEEVKAFIPAALPPEPAIEWTPALRTAHEKAMNSIGRLEGATGVLPSPHIFIYSYVRKEALLSSQIEGTQSTLTDLFAFESDQDLAEDFNDVVEVSNYVKAQESAIKQLRNGMPICNRMIKDAHAVLLSEGRGQTQNPGYFRKSQNWIGGTRPGNARFVPPPHLKVEDCMADLERFINNIELGESALVRAGIAHHQFETIHPFLDGNGRVGRLLITLILLSEKLMKEPLLYLSLYLKENRNKYYELLDSVRTTGDWESWLEFFFTGIDQTASGAAATAQALIKIFEEDRLKLMDQGRSSATLLQIHMILQKLPVFTSGRIAKEAKLTPATVNKALERMQELGIIHESTGRKRNKLFGYKRYLKELEKGTEPIAGK